MHPTQRFPLNPSPDLAMNFYAQLVLKTAAARNSLIATPIIEGVLQRAEVSLASYLAFLTEAYHHVKHTVPLLRATKAALRPHQKWLEQPLDEYIEEEAGHDEWILNDIRACGGDAAQVRSGQPSPATAAMVHHAYKITTEGNPLGFFGMVHVLEGTSVALALQAADAIQRPLALPDQAFSYLRSHGQLDQEHTAHFALLMDQIGAPDDQQAIVQAARDFYQLYAAIFRSLPMPATPRVGASA